MVMKKGPPGILASEFRLSFGEAHVLDGLRHASLEL
jgi:hypothetical protein